MNRNVVALVLTAGLTLTAAGCSTKKYVRQQTTPIINKTNELDELTRNTSNEIRNVDQRAQQGISAVDAKASQADQKALAAGQLADQAQGVASQASNRAGVLQNTVANLDNYNYDLSERRAAAVIQYLASHGVPAHTIYNIGLGEDKPVASNSSASGRAENRRVDVRLMTNTVATQSAQAQPNAAAPAAQQGDMPQSSQPR